MFPLLRFRGIGKITLFLSVFMLFALNTMADDEWHQWYSDSFDPEVIVDLGRYNSIAVDSSGRPHISYCDFTNYDLKYAVLNGTEWTIQRVDGQGTVGFDSSIAVDSSGNPHISYFDYTNKDLKYAKWTGSDWLISTVDSVGEVGEWSSIKIDSSGNPHISYYDRTNKDLKYAKQIGGNTWNIEIVESTEDPLGNTGLHTSLDLDSSNNPHISYLLRRECVAPTGCPILDNLKYARWTGSFWDIQSVANTGYYNSLALDSSDNAHMTYLGSGVNYAYWTGSTWNRQPIAEGRKSSIAIDTFDIPHIIYRDSSDGYLKYTKWSGATRNTEIIDSVQLTSSSDAFFSLALDSSNNPHVSYYSPEQGIVYATRFTAENCPGCPTADAGPDQHVNFGETVTLNGSASFDDIDPSEELTYRWTCIQGCGDVCDDAILQNVGPIPFSNRVLLNVSSELLPYVRNGAEITFKPESTVGTIIFRLEVRDSNNFPSHDEVAITVLENDKTSIFVSSQRGNDLNLGTRESPLASIEAGIAKAAEKKCADDGTPCGNDMECSAPAKCVHSDIYIESGNYFPTDTLIITDDMSIYGGFSNEGNWTRTADSPTRIEGHNIAFLVDWVMNKTIIDGFHIISADGASPATWDAGSNSIAIYVANSTNKLLISNNIIEAGRGGDGGPTPVYSTAAAPGEDGQNGEEGGIETGTSGGAGGDDGFGLSGGDGGGCNVGCYMTTYPDPFFGTTVELGGGGDGYSGAGYLGGAGGEGGCNALACGGTIFDSENGEPGGTGGTGSNGDGGLGGIAAGQFIIDPYLSLVQWIGGIGDPGTGGYSGCGGGGGGSGDGNTTWIGALGVEVPIPSAGGGGGGGGQGGYGGIGGSPGLPGGASFGIFLADNSIPEIHYNQFATNGGGKGAKGGNGQIGGDGGTGGQGGSGGMFAGDGGNGGQGGKGGSGGGGGGGAGGASCGIYNATESEPFLANNCFSFLDCTSPAIEKSVGAGGTKGEGGLPAGESGEIGIQQSVCPEGIHQSLLVCANPVLPGSPGQEITTEVDCPGPLGCDAEFSVNWGGSDVVLSLISPNGSLIDRNTMPPNVRHEKGLTFERYTVIGAQEGFWKLLLYGEDVPSEGEPVSVSVVLKPTNNIPVALCKDVTVPANSQCQAEANINDGSYDPDKADPFVSIALTPPPPYMLGTTPVTLTIEDGEGASASCNGKVTVVDLTKPSITCPATISLSADATCTATTEITVTATDSCDSSPVINSNELSVYPLGLTEVIFTATDASGNSSSCKTQVLVWDQTAPKIESITVSPNVLWPPNHKMVQITPTVISSDNCDPSPVLRLVSITMNDGNKTNIFDPYHDSTLHDGNTDNDIQVDDNGNIFLRAERSGKSSGRTYTLLYELRDSSGNVSTANATVTVPHDMR